MFFFFIFCLDIVIIKLWVLRTDHKLGQNSLLFASIDPSIELDFLMPFEVTGNVLNIWVNFIQVFLFFHKMRWFVEHRDIILVLFLFLDYARLLLEGLHARRMGQQITCLEGDVEIWGEFGIILVVFAGHFDWVRLKYLGAYSTGFRYLWSLM